MAKAKTSWPTWPMVLVVWEDHFSEDRWEDGDEASRDKHTGMVRTIGWLLPEDPDMPDRYQVVQNQAQDKQVSMRMTILKATVKSFKVLRKNG